MRSASGGSRLRFFLSLAVPALLGLLLLPAAVSAQETPAEEPDLVLFWANGCPYCERERAFLDVLRENHPDAVVFEYELTTSAANRELFVSVMETLGLEARNVPTTIVGDRVWVGWSESVGGEISAAVEERLTAPATPATASPSPAGPEESVIDVPLIGEVDVADHSLLVATLFIAAVDGLNPCSLWVLSILLALVLHTGSRRRVLGVGTTFLLVTTALYGLFIAGLYSVLSYIAFVGWIRAGVAVVALVFGAINVKDYFAYGRGVSLAIAQEHKPWMYRKMRRLTVVETPLPAVLGGTAALAIGVSLIETPCTAGFPLLWTDLLADHGVGPAAASGLFGIYMLVFLADELAVFAVAVIAMRAVKLEERHGRGLKLAGGTVMVALAGALLLAPTAMESLSGAVAVFAAAALLAAVAVGAKRWLAAGRPPGRRRPPAARAGPRRRPAH